MVWVIAPVFSYLRRCPRLRLSSPYYTGFKYQPSEAVIIDCLLIEALETAFRLSVALAVLFPARLRRMNPERFEVAIATEKAPEEVGRRCRVVVENHFGLQSLPPPGFYTAAPDCGTKLSHRPSIASPNALEALMSQSNDKPMQSPAWTTYTTYVRLKTDPLMFQNSHNRLGARNLRLRPIGESATWNQSDRPSDRAALPLLSSPILDAFADNLRPPQVPYTLFFHSSNT